MLACVNSARPVSATQESIANARITFTVEPSAIFAIFGSDMTLRDRDTYEYYFTDLDDIQRRCWPTKPNGWITPEPLPDGAGRKRPRLERNCGAVIIETYGDVDGKGTNRATYSAVRRRTRRPTRSIGPSMPCCLAAILCRALLSRRAASPSQISKHFNLYLGASFYGMNLKFIDGVEPPPRGRGVPKTHEYDIVTRKYVNRAMADAWTVGRALAHFTDA